MRYLVLTGSPRENGNTASAVSIFIEELNKFGSIVRCVRLYDKNIKPCIACRKCQDIFDAFGCPIQDDVHEIFEQVLQSDCIVLATPVYAWFCPAPMKALLDRLIYGMNKFYGREKGPSLWENKKMAILSTCGYRPEKGADLFIEGIKRYCKHSQLNYIGDLTLRDLGYNHRFLDDEKIEQARTFANMIATYE
jgi:multimeric flavodoxin WrbA